MGFAASQARLLLLTARKSDLEFRAQQITNAEMILAMQTEEIAREYSNKLSNQTIKYISTTNGTVELSASKFTEITNGLVLKKVIPGETEDDEPTYQDWVVEEDGTNELTGPQILEGLNNGTLVVFDNKGNKLDAIHNTAFSVCYNTADDAEADAVYRQKTAALQVKEKRLQMELQQVEAQQKACDSEIDAVKKIMDKNIEKTFKVFS